MLRHLKLKIKTENWCLSDNEELLEKNKTIYTKIEVLKNIELNVLPVYDDRYIKTKIWKYGDKLVIIYFIYQLSWLKCTRRWYRIQIFYIHFYLFFTCIQKQMLPVSMIRQ